MTLPEPDDAYQEDDEPTLPRARAPKISGVRPAVPLDDGFDAEDEANTEVDRQTLPADDEPNTAPVPSDVAAILRGISASSEDDDPPSDVEDLPTEANSVKKGDRS